MAEEKLLTIRDVALMLGLSEKEVMDLAENGTIPAYNVGGVYLRFKRAQVEQLKKKNGQYLEHTQKNSFKDKLFDFYYFYDFYILSFILVVGMLYVILK